LVTGDDGTTNSLGSNLGHVHDDDGRNHTNTETSDNATTDENTNGGGSDLQSDTAREDEASDDNGRTTADPVREITTEQSTEEGTGRQDRSD